jgi:hypothetical protein
MTSRRDERTDKNKKGWNVGQEREFLFINLYKNRNSARRRRAVYHTHKYICVCECSAGLEYPGIFVQFVNSSTPLDVQTLFCWWELAVEFQLCDY